MTVQYIATGATNVPGVVSDCVRLISDTNLSNIYHYYIPKKLKENVQ